MPSREPEIYKDKIEVSLDGRQIFYLFFGGAVIVGLVFVLGVMVGRRVEARGHLDRADTQSTRDPLAALDRLERSDDLSFRRALTGGAAPTDVEKAIGEIEKRRSAGNAARSAPMSRADADRVKADRQETEHRSPRHDPASDARSDRSEATQNADGKPVTRPEPEARLVSDRKPDGKADAKATDSKAEIRSDGKAQDGKAETRGDTKPNDAKVARGDGKEARGDVKLADGKEARGDTRLTRGDVKPADSKETRSDGKATEGREVRGDAKATDGKEVRGDAKATDGKEVRNDAKATDGKVRFTLQLSSFQDRSEADAFLATLKSAGFQPYVVEAEVSGKGTFYRVRLGSYRSLEAANDARAEYERSARKTAQVMRL
jgi:DedD protein